MAWSFQKWYEENGEDLNDKRRDRYHNDPEYRAKVLARNREAARRNREKKREEAAQLGEAKRVRMSRSLRGQYIDVEIDGKRQRVQVFTLGALATYLGKARRTMYKWEREGLLPDTSFRSSGGHRLYTREMMDWIKDHLEDLGKVDRTVKVRRRGDQKGTVKIVQWSNGKKERVRLFRLGVLARVLGKTRETLLQWERNELIPVTPLRTSKMEHRMYTADMISVVKEAFEAEGSVLRGADAKGRFKKHVFAGWKSVKGARLVDPLEA